MKYKCKGQDNSLNSWIDKKDIVIQNELFSRTRYLQQKQNRS